MMYRLLNLFWKKRKKLSIQSSRLKALLLFCCLFWYAASGFLYFELQAKPDLSWADALWWSFVTMTTVGYGDYFPVTTGGRYFVGLPVMIFGIGFLGFIISEVAALLIESRSRRLKGMTDIKATNHILIVNINRIEEVIKLIDELRADPTTQEKEICLIDENFSEMPPEFIPLGVHFVRGNPTHETVMKQANLARADYVIILSPNPNDPHSDDLNLAATLVIESINPDIFSIVEIVDHRKTMQFEYAGSNSIICVSDLTSNLIIQELQDPGIKNVVQELTTNRFGHQLYLVSLEPKEDRTFRDLITWGLDRSITFLGVIGEEGICLNCPGDKKLTAGHRAIAISEKRPVTINF